MASAEPKLRRTENYVKHLYRYGIKSVLLTIDTQLGIEVLSF